MTTGTIHVGVNGNALCGCTQGAHPTSDTVFALLRAMNPLPAQPGDYCGECLGAAMYIVSAQMLAAQGAQAAARFLVWASARGAAWTTEPAQPAGAAQ